MMMPWAGGSAWMVIGPVLGAVMLVVAVLVIVVMYRDPRPPKADPSAPAVPTVGPQDVDPSARDHAEALDSPEARAARGEMDVEQLHREQRKTP